MENKLIAVTVILTALLSISEALALIPSVKANSLFEAVRNILYTIKNFLTKK